jgi:hypothetical protein
MEVGVEVSTGSGGGGGGGLAGGGRRVSPRRSTVRYLYFVPYLRQTISCNMK